MASPIPATPAPAHPYNVANNTIRPVAANADAQAYFNQQSPEDQAKIKASWGGRPAPTGAGPFRGLNQMLHNNYQNSYLNQWYNNAQNAGSPVPVSPPAAPAAPAAPQPYQPPQPNGAMPNNVQSGYTGANVMSGAPNPNQPPPGGTPTSNMLTNNYQPPAAPAAPRNVGDEYEAWKANGRQGPRPEGT